MEDTLGYKFLVENNLLEKFINELKRIRAHRDISDYILERGNTAVFFECAFLWVDTKDGPQFWDLVSCKYRELFYELYTKEKEKKTLTPEFYID